MYEQGNGISRNPLFLSLFAIKWTVQEIVLGSINFQFSWITTNIKTKLVLPPASPPFCPTLSPQARQWPCWHPGIPAPWRSCVTPLHLPLSKKVSKGLERDSDGCGFLLHETCGLLLYESCVCACGLIPSLLSIHPFLGADGFCRAVFDISIASALHGCFYSLIFQCKQ